MKTLALAISAAFAVLGSQAAVIENSFAVESAGEESCASHVPMTFRGPIEVGGPDVVINGTAQQIYETILARNPSYDQWDFPEFQEKMKSRGITREEWEADDDWSEGSSLERRQLPVGFDDSKRIAANCRWGRPVPYWYGCFEGFRYLKGIGEGACEAKPRECARVSCSKGCGMWFCSDNDEPASMPCNQVRDMIIRLAHDCGAEKRWQADGIHGRLRFRNHSFQLGWAPDC